MDRCVECDRLVDTDYDLDCYISITIGGREVCVCESCREAWELEQQEIDDEVQRLD